MFVLLIVTYILIILCNLSAHVKTKTCQLKSDIKKMKMINNINTFKDIEYIEKYKHDEFKNANTKLQPEDY